ncbi:glycosyltransferase [Nonlabens marinus]|uniref:Glycosyltransferase n=1 Tax=Nonlabens marinus S1-08 TaxID=1454201 RepID=W8VUS6_9FLAO|nr:glycosyltransferase [Nonlabens marinus]BAO54858.1 glycosyltransferase [Nonlabens marinus S1-08]
MATESNKRKIVLFVPLLGGGGAEMVFVNLSNYFVSNGFDVVLFYAYGDSFLNLLDKRVINKPVAGTKYSSIRTINRVIRILKSYVALCKLLKKEQPDYLLATVHESNMIAYFAHKKVAHRTKLILSMANIYRKSTLPFFLRPVLKTAFKNAQNLIANSPDTAASYKRFVGNDSLPVHIIGNPTFQENTNIKPLDFDFPYLLTVGRLESQKNQSLMIDAFYKVCLTNKTIKLIILGEGTLRGALERRTKSLGLTDRVIFMGFVEDTSRYYSNAEAFILSSDFEGFGNVIVEAMSYGIPVVSTDCPGGPNFIINKPTIGELCEMQNPEALSAAILKVLHHPENYSREEIINRAKDFSIKKIGEIYVRLLESVR